MNICVLSGRLTKDPFVNGAKEKPVVKFVLACRYGYDSENKKERVEFVPCVAFNLSEAMIGTLKKGIFICLKGRVSTSQFKSGDETKWATEVIVDPTSIEFTR